MGLATEAEVCLPPLAGALRSCDSATAAGVGIKPPSSMEADFGKMGVAACDVGCACGDAKIVVVASDAEGEVRPRVAVAIRPRGFAGKLDCQAQPTNCW